VSGKWKQVVRAAAQIITTLTFTENQLSNQGASGAVHSAPLIFSVHSCPNWIQRWSVNCLL